VAQQDDVTVAVYAFDFRATGSLASGPYSTPASSGPGPPVDYASPCHRPAASCRHPASPALQRR
jgi:hypothetical protein